MPNVYRNGIFMFVFYTTFWDAGDTAIFLRKINHVIQTFQYS